MTLDGMNAYLEEKGFEVERKRDSKKGLYEFTIRKPGYYPVTKAFKYPQSDSWTYRTQKMEEFLESLVRKFYEGEDKRMVEPTVPDHLQRMVMSGSYGELNIGGMVVPIKASSFAQSPGDLDRFECTIEKFGPTAPKWEQWAWVNPPQCRLPAIKDVIYNDPATIVLWEDGTKTVVKCQEDREFDPAVGLAMAFCEKAFGDKTTSHKVFKKWLPKEIKDEPILYPNIAFDNSPLTNVLKNAKEAFESFCDDLIAKKKQNT